MMYAKRGGSLTLGLLTILFLLAGIIFAGSAAAGTSQSGDYDFWKSVGEIASAKAIKNTEARHCSGEFVALTNAGYAEVDGRTTQAALNGLRPSGGQPHGGVGTGENRERELTPALFR